MYKNMFGLVMLGSLTACAAITSGSSQSVSITTDPVTGATCQLSNDAGSWFVSSTPGSVVIHREASDLTVICKKGALSGTARVVSYTKSLAFGNIIAGGLIGAAIDRGNGAAFDYPTLITVPMARGGKHTDIVPPEPPPTDPNTRNNNRP